MGLLGDRLSLIHMMVFDRQRPTFTCPICSYSGVFLNSHAPTGFRLHSRCPRCKGGERHRLQHLVMQDLLAERDASKMSMLHFAPESWFRPIFARRFGTYQTADLGMRGVTHRVDICRLPLPDGSYDIVYASHVLEHVLDDNLAISEIRRVLRPGGIAILPVPLFAEETIEYAAANPHEHHHVRAPGLDYFDRYTRHFRRVEKYASDQYPEKYQLYLYQDRTSWPMKNHPHLRPMPGERHLDIVPVCYV